jgi:hypothetical protein
MQIIFSFSFKIRMVTPESDITDKRSLYIQSSQANKHQKQHMIWTQKRLTITKCASVPGAQ